MTVTHPAWVRPVYAAALVLHALAVLALLALAGLVAVSRGADSAPDTLFFTLATVVSLLVPVVPSTIALLSAWMCRRQGVAPSPGHMGLAIAGAAAILVVLAIAVLR